MPDYPGDNIHAETMPAINDTISRTSCTDSSQAISEGNTIIIHSPGHVLSLIHTIHNWYYNGALVRYYGA